MASLLLYLTFFLPPCWIFFMSTKVQALAFSNGIINYLFFTQLPVFRRILRLYSHLQLHPAGMALLLTQLSHLRGIHHKFVDFNAPPFSQRVPLPHPITSQKLANVWQRSCTQAHGNLPRKDCFGYNAQ